MRKKPGLAYVGALVTVVLCGSGPAALASKYVFVNPGLPPAATGGGAFFGISNTDVIIGNYYDARGHAVPVTFTKQSGFQPIALDPSLTADGYAAGYGINSAGEVVGRANGQAFVKSGTQTNVVQLGTLFTSLEGVNDAGVFAGEAANSGSDLNTALIDDHGTITRLVGIDARGINSSGATVVEDLFGASVYKNGIYTPISVPGADAVFGGGINDSGTVAGTYRNARGIFGYLDVKGKVTTLADPLAVHGTSIYGISTDGTIVGDYLDANFVAHPFFATPATVSEPGSITGLELCLVGLMASSLRRLPKTRFS